jgi:hypothetical protein
MSDLKFVDPKIHREWVMRFRMPAVDFLTEELGHHRIAVLMNTQRPAFEKLVADLIASVVARQ